MNLNHRAPRLLTLVVAASIAAACGSGAATPSPTPSALAGVTLALVHGNLIDGTGAAPIADATLLIAGDRIAALGPAATTPVPAGIRTIDLHGAVVLPGFINAHVHYAFDEAKLRAWAEGGVTTVRDEGAFSRSQIEGLKAFKDGIAADPHLARLVSMGQALKLPGGYGQREVTSPDEGRQAVLDEAANGVDGIKITNEDGYAGQSGLPRMTAEEYKAIVDAAREKGLPVSGHITQGNYMMALLQAGVNDIAHIPYDHVPPDAVQYMADHDVYLTPTFTVYKGFGVSLYAAEQNLHQLVAKGVHIALGNDYGGGPGEFELGIPMVEIEEMAASGMTPMQIVQASTINGARLLRLDQKLGTLEAGKAADILVVAGDPLSDLQALRTVRLVVHAGTVIRNELT